jgi:hypothetical protein
MKPQLTVPQVRAAIGEGFRQMSPSEQTQWVRWAQANRATSAQVAEAFTRQRGSVSQLGGVAVRGTSSTPIKRT